MTKKEAYSIIEDKMPNMHKDVKEAIKTLIPELGYSDDMIRKLIYYAIKYNTKIASKKHKELALEYLERKGERKSACGVDKFTITLRNCLSADSELTREQADIFARAYGEDLYNVALGKMKTGLNKEDIEEYRNEVEFDPKPGERFWVRCKTEKSENLWFDKGYEREAHAIQGKDGMMYVVCINDNGNFVSYQDKEKFLKTFEIIEKPE